MGAPHPSRQPDRAADASPRRIRSRHLRAFAVSTLIALMIYAAAFAAVEYLTYEYGNRNPIFEIVTFQHQDPALLILGASHALPLEYDGMNEEVEARVRGPVLNLAITGGGVVPNAFFLDAFVRKHGPERARAVLYVADSFAFYSAQWNEARMTDTELWQRAPLDPDVAIQLVDDTIDYGLSASVPLNYLSGFSKLNDPPTWFAPDVWDGEAEFDASYEPSDFQDRERIDFLYPDQIDPDAFDRYLGYFAALVERTQELDLPLIVVKPPLRSAFLEKIPGEAEFDRRLRALLEARGIPFHDFSAADYPADFFYDPDHLNREGVRHFLDRELGMVIDMYLR